MTDSIHIVCDIPKKCLNPNTPCHYLTKSKAKKEAKNTVFFLAKHEVGNKPPRWEYATITIRGFYKDRRRHDADNLLASLKSHIDGLVKAGVLLDDNKVTYVIRPALCNKIDPHVDILVEKGEPE